MSRLIERDYFTDYEILKDPYAYFEELRDLGPIYQPPGRDYLVVTGFQETIEVLRNSEDFSAVIALQGASRPLPFAVAGSDIREQIESHRAQFEGSSLLVNLDDRTHSNLRALVNTLFTPSRLKASEAFIHELAASMVRKAVAKGGCDLVNEIAIPFVTIVVADLLGVPADDQKLFMDAFMAAPPPGNLEGNSEVGEVHPFELMGSYFTRYIIDRRANPQPGILSELANAAYPDGSNPDVLDLVQLGMFMFGAGQDTSAKLIGNAMKYIVDQEGLQASLRADRSLIPALVEEVLRIEGSAKQTARVARRDTKIGDMKIPAGTKVQVALSAANRDASRWDNPRELILGRPKIKEHVAFGRGPHVCAGAPLARAEVRIILELLLDLTSNIDLDEARHGKPGDRQVSYDPSFSMRGFEALHVKLEPARDNQLQSI